MRKTFSIKKVIISVIAVFAICVIARCVYVEHEFGKIIDELNNYKNYAELTDDYEKCDVIREFVYQNSVLAAGKDVLLDSTFDIKMPAITKKGRVVNLFNLRYSFMGGVL